MAKGKLTLNEKYAIQGMLHSKKSVKEIQAQLERPNSKAVESYINDELSRIQDSIVKANIPSDEDIFQAEVSQETFTEAVHKLVRDGMGREDAEALVNTTLDQLNMDPDNGQQLYTLAIQHKSVLAKTFMVTKTQSGKDGVAIMTNPASSRGDEAGKRARQKAHSRSTRGNLYKPKEREIQ